MKTRLSISKQEKLKDLLKELNNEGIEQFLHSQIYIFHSKLRDICHSDELSSLRPHIATIKLFAEFSENMIKFAQFHEVTVPTEMHKNISYIASITADLITFKNNIESNLEKAEEVHQQVVSSQRLRSQSTPTRSRTIESFNEFRRDIATINKNNPKEKLIKCMASIATTLFKNEMLLPVFVEQLNELSSDNDEFLLFSNGVEHLMQQKTKPNLEGFVTNFRKWQDKNNETLNGCRASINLVNTIAMINYDIATFGKMADYPTLAKAELEIRKYYLNSEECDERIEPLVKLLKFENQIENLQELQIKKIRSLIPLRNHIRQRSKSASDIHATEPVAPAKPLAESVKPTSSVTRTKRLGLQTHSIFAHQRQSKQQDKNVAASSPKINTKNLK